MTDSTPQNHEQSPPAKERPVIRRTCPKCGERVPTKPRGVALCPKCGVDMNGMLRELRYSAEPPDHRASLDLLLREGWLGPVAVMLMGAIATLAGWWALRQDDTTPFEGRFDGRLGLLVGPVFVAHGLWVLLRYLWKRRCASRPE